MSEQKFKAYRYYEGICSSSNFVKELAKVLSVGVRSNEIKDSEGNVMQEPFVYQTKNWDIVYPAPDESLVLDSNPSSEEYKRKIENQIEKISDTVIMKTKTTPIDLSGKEDDIAVDSDANKESLEMYLEIYKPTYIANPEQYPLDIERSEIIPKVITKEMYKNAFMVTKRVEEVITVSSATGDTPWDSPTSCNIDKPSNALIQIDGPKVYTSTSECSMVVSKIIAAYSGDADAAGFYMPQVPGSSTNTSRPEDGGFYLEKTDIMNIKYKDNELYNLIRTELSIDDSTYQRLSQLQFIVECINSTEYYLSIEGVITSEKYTIVKDSVYEAYKDGASSSTILTDIIPEYFIDGVYIPISKDYWEYDTNISYNRGIRFIKDLEGDISTNGNIVLRYDISVEATETKEVSDRNFMLNNHYVLMRLFDGPLNDAGDGPALTVYDDNGSIVAQKAHVSDWAKLSWYQDFEEIYKDDIDADSSTTTVSDGTLLVPLETAGLNSETKLRYWINTNNDRFSLIVMGNPSLDVTRDRHLVSACYCGKINSFDDSIADIAGNFALFTSSSTEPCKTTMEIEKVYNKIVYDEAKHEDSLSKAEKRTCSPDLLEYYINLPEERCFNKDIFPKYMIVETSTGAIKQQLTTVARVSYPNNNEAKITLHSAYDANHTLYVFYGYYNEKIVLDSGVERDMFGNVAKVTKTDTYGLNTSDGTTSVMMYHTRAKSYYQKHQLMFTTTEEYMSKVMYGKSQYTGEYYADRIKITHSNDGPRGMLEDIIVIDNSSLYPLDELVINKDFEKDPNEYEETYVYFPITAPFSPLSDGPNARYGFAIKEKEVEPKWTDEKTIVKLAIQELELLANEAWTNITEDIYPLGQTTNGSTVLWEIVNNTKWYKDEANKTNYTPIDLCLKYTENYKGDGDLLEPVMLPENAVTPVASFDGDILSSKVTLNPSGFTLKNSDNKIYYGIADEIPTVYEGDIIKVIIEPENNVGDYTHADYEYPIYNFLYSGVLDGNSASEISVKDAKPDKYLILYEVTEGLTVSRIKSYAAIKLTQDMIKYPCELQVNIATGVGKLNIDAVSTVNYGSSKTIGVKPDTGWSIEKVTVESGETTEDKTSSVSTVNGYQAIELSNITKDTYVTFTLKSASL